MRHWGKSETVSVGAGHLRLMNTLPVSCVEHPLRCLGSGSFQWPASGDRARSGPLCRCRMRWA